MKCTIPEIAWHNRDPVLSLDIQASKGNDSFYRLVTGGTDTHVLIWLLSVGKGGAASLECAADLKRHTKPVNCVRFSPSGEILASGDDEACIILWKMKVSSDPPDIFNGEEESFKEQWASVKVLRGHLQDVYDLSWSADSKNLISGSVDNTAILWDVSSGKNLGILTEHKGFVQGVSWDPCGQYVATVSSDRVCRVYNTTSRRVVSKMYKGVLPGRPVESETKPTHYFHDDTLKSFFRRLTFTPDGQLLIVPAGLVEEPDKKSTNCTMIFHRNCLQKPVVYLPSLSQYSVAVRCCPVLFNLREMDSPPLFQLPYRIVIAIATQSNVLLYDTQHAAPFAFITNIHYTRLTDLSWSSDGRVLVVSSTDGYCSVITFRENELGTVYSEDSAQHSNPGSKTMEDKPTETPIQKSECGLNISEDANMSCKEDSKKNGDSGLEGVSVLGQTPNKGKTIENEEDIKNKNLICKKKDTPMEIDDFSLVYEGTIGEPVLESKLQDADKLKMEEKQPIVTSFDRKVSAADTESNLKAKNKTNDQFLKESCSGHEAVENDKTCNANVKKEESPNKDCGPTKSMQDEALTSPKSGVNTTPGSNYKKTPRRVQLITLSSPKSKKKLLE